MLLRFKKKIIEILIKKTELALENLKKQKYDIKDIAIVGGVAANKDIKESLRKFSQINNHRLIFPPLELCGDNAAMIAWVCLQHYKMGTESDLAFKPNPRLSIKKIRVS